MKDGIIASLINENKRLYDKVSLLEVKLGKMEREFHASLQYNRRNNIEIQGISESVEDNELDKKVIEILIEIDVSVNANVIEA